MHAQGVDILNEADGDHLTLGVPDHFQLQLFPAQNRFLHQDLAHQRGLQAPGADGFQLLRVVDQAAAGAAHGIGGTQHHGIAQVVRNLQGLVHRIGHLTAGHLDAQLVHGFLEFDPVLAPLDGVHLDADDLHAVFVQNTVFRQLRTEVQAGLAAQVG